MKKEKFIVGVIACTLAALAMTGCDLALDSEANRATVSGYAVKSIAISGETTSLEQLGDFTAGSGVVTATYYDASTADVTSKCTYSGYDMSTLGEQTVTVSYTKDDVTVTTSYTIQVTLAVSSIAVTTEPTVNQYIFVNSKPTSVAPDTTGMVITATYTDNSTAVVDNSNVTLSAVSATAGTQDVTVTYSKKTATYSVTVTLKGYAATVGATDNSSAFWGEHSGDWTVPDGSIIVAEFTNYTSAANNWNNFIVKLRDTTSSGSTSGTEYAILRADNFGWGDGYSTATLSSNWDWDNFKTYMNGADVIVKVVNNAASDNTADVYCSVVGSDGNSYYQNYENITVTPSNLQLSFTIELAHIIFE